MTYNEINQQNSAKPKITGHKLGSGVNWQTLLKQTGVKSRKTRPGCITMS